MLSLEKFEWSKHEAIYAKWFEQRKAQRPPDELVAPTGLVVLNDDLPICIGFISRTDSGVAVLTNFISDPNSDKEIRSKSLDVLIEALSDIMYKEGFLYLAASTPYKTMIDKFEKHGFMKHGQSFDFGRFYGMATNDSSDYSNRSDSGRCSEESSAAG